MLKVSSIDNNRQTALHRAALYGNYEAISFCLNNTNLKINSKDFQDNTPLHFAAQNFHVNCLRLMILHRRYDDKSHLYLRMRNKKGETPIQILITAVKKLIESKSSFAKSELSEMDILNYLYQDQIPEIASKLILTINSEVN